MEIVEIPGGDYCLVLAAQSECCLPTRTRSGRDLGRLLSFLGSGLPAHALWSIWTDDPRRTPGPANIIVGTAHHSAALHNIPSSGGGDHAVYSIRCILCSAQRAILASSTACSRYRISTTRQDRLLLIFPEIDHQRRQAQGFEVLHPRGSSPSSLSFCTPYSREVRPAAWCLIAAAHAWQV